MLPKIERVPNPDPEVSVQQWRIYSDTMPQHGSYVFKRLVLTGTPLPTETWVREQLAVNKHLWSDGTPMDPATVQIEITEHPAEKHIDISHRPKSDRHKPRRYIHWSETHESRDGVLHQVRAAPYGRALRSVKRG